MKESKQKIPAIPVIYTLLTLVLVAIFSFSVFGETIPVNDGAGFDGEFYREVFRNFSGTFFTDGYDSFRIQRIFPFCFMNVIYRLAGISLTNAHMVNGMYALLFINLALQLFLFFKFVRFLKWKPVTTVILFALFFFNHATLKNYGYEPFQTDPYAITIAMAAYYLFIKGRARTAFAISLLGLFTWPTVTYVMVLLLLFPRPKDCSAITPPVEGNPYLLDRTFPKLFQVLPIAYGLGAGALVLLFYAFHKQGILSSLLLTEASPALIVASLALFVAALLAAFFKVPTLPYSARSFIKSFNLKAFLGTLLCIVAVSVFLRLHTNDEFFFDAKLFLLQILIRPLKYPLVTFAGHVVYWGALSIVLIVLAKDFTRNFAEKSPGHALVLLAFLFFALDSESRHIATFIPLFLPALGAALDKANLSAKAAVFIVALQILLAHFYVPINVEGFAESLEKLDFNTPEAQRYFMNYGPWMTFGHFMEWLVTALGAFIGTNEVFKHAKRPQSGN